MKTKIIALALFATTAAAVAFYPGQGSDPVAIPLAPPVTAPPSSDPLTNQRPRIDVVFVLDTTGSMSGLIQAAKEKIWSIATTMAQAQPTPVIRMGLVAYRDRGDDYVTRVLDLSEDLDSMYATLMDLQAGGGGDGPESVNQALYDAVHGVSWGQGSEVYKVVFLVGDAPPHMDYQDDVKYPDTVAVAQSRGIVVNAVQCGNNQSTTGQWQRIAGLGDGRYFQVGQGGSAVAITSPYDKELATLSEKLDATRFYYGSEEERKEKQHKLDAARKLHSEASVESRARRAVFNASPSGAANLLGKKELVEDLASGRVSLDEIAPERLPAPLVGLAPERQQAVVEEVGRARDELKGRIEDLARQRSDYLAKKVKERGGAKDSLDYKVFSAVREQAAGSGLRYESDAPEY